MFIKIVFVIFLMISAKVFALDGKVFYRCAESYKINKFCYPSSATLQSDGTCACPATGCSGCSVEDYYCYFPINVLGMIGSEDINVEASVSVHHQHHLNHDACGDNNIQPRNLGLWTHDYEGKTKREKVSLESSGTGRNEEHKIFSNTSLSNVEKMKIKPVGFGGHYAVYPRIEERSTGERYLMMYFTQAGHDKRWHPVVGSGNKYFHFEDSGFSNQEWDVSGLDDSPGEIWKSIPYCNVFNDYNAPNTLHHDPDGDGGSDEGKECINNPYIKSLFLYKDDSTLNSNLKSDIGGLDKIRYQASGLKLPSNISEAYFPDQIQYLGGSMVYSITNDPRVKWEYRGDSTFLYPKTRIKIADKNIDLQKECIEDGVTCVDGGVLDSVFSHIYEEDWKYNFLFRVERDDSLELPELCLYSCIKNNDDKCVEDHNGLITTSPKTLLELLDGSNATDAKETFKLGDCKMIAENDRNIDNLDPVIRISLEKGDINYLRPSVIVTLQDKLNDPVTKEIDLSKDMDEIADFLDNNFDDESYIKNDVFEKIIYPYLLTVKAEEKEYSVNNLKIKICYLYNNYTYGSVVTNRCVSDESPIHPYNLLGYKNNYNNILSKHSYNVVSRNEDYMCLHNLLPIEPYNINEGTGFFNKTHPYFLYRDYSSNIENDSFPRYNRHENLCIPVPKREILKLRYNIENGQNVLYLAKYKEPFDYQGDSSVDNRVTSTFGNITNNNRLDSFSLQNEGDFLEYEYDYYNKFKITKSDTGYSIQKDNNEEWSDSTELLLFGCSAITKNGYAFPRANLEETLSLVANSTEGKKCDLSIGYSSASMRCGADGTWEDSSFREIFSSCNGSPSCYVRLRKNGNRWSSTFRTSDSDLDNNGYHNKVDKVMVSPGCVVGLYNGKNRVGQSGECLGFYGNDRDDGQNIEIGRNNSYGRSISGASSIFIGRIRDYNRDRDSKCNRGDSPDRRYIVK